MARSCSVWGGTAGSGSSGSTTSSRRRSPALPGSGGRSGRRRTGECARRAPTQRGCLRANTEGRGEKHDVRIHGQDGDVPGYAGGVDGGHGVAEGGGRERLGARLLRSPHRAEPGRDRLRHGGKPDDPKAPQADAVSEKIKICFISKKGLDTKRRVAIYNKTHL